MSKKHVFSHHPNHGDASKTAAANPANPFAVNNGPKTAGTSSYKGK